MEFQRGQKSKLDALTDQTRFDVGVRVSAPAGVEIDISCFGLDGKAQLSDDRYFIFYNQPTSPCDGLKLNGRGGGYDQRFTVDLSKLPETINELVFTAAIDGSGDMSQLGPSSFALEVENEEFMIFPFKGELFGQEKAMMIARVYRKGVWRVAAVGQGFNGGLEALLNHFGGEADDAPAATPPPPKPKPAPEPPKPAPTLSLGKVTLEKRGQSQKLSLSKQGPGQDTIHINLNWDQPKKRGWFGGGGNVDLDLGCMFQLITGEKGVIQPLGGNFGAQHRPPWILLDKDDRSGAANDGENMRIYRPDMIARVLIFAMIYEGGSNFTTVNGRVKVKDQNGNEILIRLDAPDPRRTFCGVCMIERDGEGLKITKEERYFMHHPECDYFYNFGFRWAPGQK